MAEENMQKVLMARAIKDAAFRQELLSNPRVALARDYNIRIPEHVTFRVIEDAPDTITLLLPATEAAAQELSDAELEAVAGAGPGAGTFPWATYRCPMW